MNSHFMRKMKKLRRDPEAFFRDSRLNLLKKIDVKKIEGLVKTEVRNALDNEVKKLKNNEEKKNIKMDPIFREKKNILAPIDCFDFDYLVNGLRSYEAVGVFIKPIEPSLKPALCVLDKDRVEFLSKFLVFINDEAVNIKYKFKDKTKSPNSISELYNDFLEVKSIDVRLSTNRVLSKDLMLFWFRLEFCESNSEFITFPTANYISRRLWIHSIGSKDFFKSGLQDYSTLSELPHEREIDFDIDLVFTWVNSDDSDWKEMYSQYKPIEDSDATSTSRFKSRDELQYAIRSWEKYGSFINRIFIVSNCKAPEWLDLSNEKVRWVSHEEILPESALPTFSSHAIETSLHKIKGLSNHFIYSNDDFFLVKPVSALDFFYSNGIAKLRLENFGNVNGYVRNDDPDYLNGARNSNILLERDFGKFTTQLHTHSPQSMRVDVLDDMNERYSVEFERTTHNKFRAADDIAVTGYLYHHFAILSGKALDSTDRTELIQQNHNFVRKINNIITLNQTNDYHRLPLSVCLNDGNDSHLNDDWNNSLESFLSILYPSPSELEK
ncbi:stealth conserved region 3 domain-containing protein [Psychrobacter immobilis]|uniref:stealth conserved region 3 domain-containing protein n=1 Tax=Psychrobacter immobilis TaxID=498 RepID=UPI00191B6595|nr:stealth conserved region 3 domain-containing protein [Psychrobacter immobilis]